MQTDEVALIERSQGGDLDAFNSLVLAYQGQVYGLCLRMLGAPQPAEDAAQEAFVRAYRAIRRFDIKKSFYPWFYRILKNVCLTALKKIRPGDFSIDGEDAPPLAAPPNDPSSHAERKELRAVIDQAMSQLSDAHRDILYLSHFEELSYREIAECLRIPIGTVMSRLWAARRALKNVLGPAMLETGNE